MFPLRPKVKRELSKMRRYKAENQLTLYRVIKRKDMNAFAVFDFITCLNITQVAQLDSQIVSRDCVESPYQEGAVQLKPHPEPYLC